MTRTKRIGLKAGAWVLCLLPLLALLYRGMTDDLGANPISFVTNWLGQWTFRLLLVGLALTPLRILFGLAWPLQLRRLVGLFAFCYACLHLGVWVVLDHYFDWGEMWTDLLKRRYITAGMAALALLVPLAATSTGGHGAADGRRGLATSPPTRLSRRRPGGAPFPLAGQGGPLRAVRIRRDRGAAPRDPALGRRAPSAAATPSSGTTRPSPA